ncbi:MAG: peptidylprolyl isomerase [Gemmatimonadota bacterium]
MSARWWILVLAAGLIARPVAAQIEADSADSGSVDRIVAIVGNSVILFSQIQEEILAQRMNGLTIPTDPESQKQLQERVLADLIDGELVLQEATTDTSIHVTDEEVSQAVDQQIRQQRRTIPSEVEYRKELQNEGFVTPEDYRRWLTDQQKRFFLRQRYMTHLRDQKKIEPVQPTDKEMRDYFESQKLTLTAEQRKTPATVSFRQIVIAPRAGAAARAEARARADSIVTELRNGADFAAAARRFSEDPVSKDKGGDLGWFRRGQMVAEFEREAFRLRPGVISEPIESSYGYHIIQVQRIQPTEIQARHILITPAVTAQAADSASALANRLADLVRDGAAVDSLQVLYHDRAEEKLAADVPVDKLPEAYATLAQADSGSVQVIKLPADPEVRSKYAVVTVDRRRSEGELAFEDVREQIRSTLADQLAIHRYLAQLRKHTFVEIRPI